MSFLFIFTSYLLLIYNLQCLRYSSFYIRFERVFLEKRQLASKKITKTTFFAIIGLDHFVTNTWLAITLFQNDFHMMVIFFAAMYHSTLIYRKIITWYALAWWLDKIVIINGICVLVSNFYGFYWFKNLNWNHMFLFSVCFFLITFTTYFFKQLTKYGKKSWNRVQKIF